MRKIASIAVGVLALAVLIFVHFPIVFGQSAAASASPAFAYLFGEAALRGGNSRKAELLVRRSLRLDPFEAATIGLLGRIREGRGDRAGTARIMNLAAAYSWRDEPTQRWLFQTSMTSGALAEGILHADALARTSQGQDVFLSVLFLGALNPQAAPLVADRLAANPPYRSAFFSLAAQLEPSKFDAYQHFLALLAERRSTANDNELKPFVGRLIATGAIDRAEAIWFQSHRGASLKILRDGNFTGLAGSAGSDPFGWIVGGEASAELFVGSRDGTPGDVALNVRTNEAGPAALFSQVIRAPAGRYRFRVDSHVEEGSADAFKWRLQCLSDGRAVQLSQAGQARKDDWLTSTYQFTSTGCDGYRLTAYLDNPSGASQSVWFRNAQISMDGATPNS